MVREKKGLVPLNLQSRREALDLFDLSKKTIINEFIISFFFLIHQLCPLSVLEVGRQLAG